MVKTKDCGWQRENPGALAGCMRESFPQPNEMHFGVADARVTEGVKWQAEKARRTAEDVENRKVQTWQHPATGSEPRRWTYFAAGYCHETALGSNVFFRRSGRRIH